MRFALHLLLLSVFVFFNSCPSVAASSSPSNQRHSWGRRSYPQFFKANAKFANDDDANFNLKRILKRGDKKRPDLRKDVNGGAGVSKMKSSSETSIIPAVDSKTMGEVMMASVIATAIQIIKDKRLVNKTEESNMISIIENILPSAKKDAVFES
jgi:hypothetical protein